VAAGEHVAAFAVTETDAGSDLSGVSLSATRTASGWRLKGSKTLITNAGLADGYTVLARSSGEPGERGGLSMFYVSSEAPGLSVERFEVMAPHPIGDVHFADVEVDEDCLLGEEGAGMDLALGNLARFRTSVAAAANGFAERALAESVTHLEGRKQFGRPLSSFQGLRFDLAEMDVRLAAAELLVREAALSVDTEGDATQDVARAKLFATETAGWICDRAVQHLGGLGVRRGQVVERLFREVRALRIYEGTSEIQKLILAKELLRRHRSE
jgi:acyl-CoA dehydrogenase